MDTTHFKVFRAGTKAFIDSFSGLIPCTVLIVNKTSNGHIIGDRDAITVIVNETRGGYTKGEILDFAATSVPPREMINKKQYYKTISTNYVYEESWSKEIEKEYDTIAERCAKQNTKEPPKHGVRNIVLRLINKDIEAFEKRVELSAYAIAMERIGG